MTTVFVLRVDTISNLGEGEAYPISDKGIVHCNVWQSPKLSDHQIIIATGKKAIDEVYKQFKNYNIRTVNP